MTGNTSAAAAHASGHRLCRRPGCARPVKKATAKYCSIGCSATDPERISRLRERSRARGRTVLPMSRQLTISFGSANDAEACLGRCDGRDDVPRGMSRLVG